MHERLQERLDELQSEFAAGQNTLADLDAKRSDLQQTLLRISGAIQVLTELLDTDDASRRPPLPGST